MGETNSNQENFSFELKKHYLGRSFAQSTIIVKKVSKVGSFKVTGVVEDAFTPSGPLYVVPGDLEMLDSFTDNYIEQILTGAVGFHQIHIFPEKGAISCFVFTQPQFTKQSFNDRFLTIQSILKRTFRRANYFPSNKTINFSDPFFKSLGLAETTMKLVGTDLYIRLDFEQEIRMTKGDDEIDK
ncbi:MAG TPA: hypothetical protein PKW95_22190 [bacterium]|nr:hypothetical protein [bacterium]